MGDLAQIQVAYYNVVEIGLLVTLCAREEHIYFILLSFMAGFDEFAHIETF